MWAYTPCPPPTAFCCRMWAGVAFRTDVCVAAVAVAAAVALLVVEEATELHRISGVPSAGSRCFELWDDGILQGLGWIEMAVRGIVVV